VPIDLPIPPSLMSTYYVIPIKGDDPKRLQRCDYYDYKWKRLDKPVLDSCTDDYKTDFVQVVQPSVEQLHARDIDVSFVDEELTLFAAVAKTLQASVLMPNLLSASGNAVVIPVVDDTRRGLILVFARSTAGIVTDLVATSDPEIKNSTNGR